MYSCTAQTVIQKWNGNGTVQAVPFPFSELLLGIPRLCPWTREGREPSVRDIAVSWVDTDGSVLGGHSRGDRVIVHLLLSDRWHRCRYWKPFGCSWSYFWSRKWILRKAPKSKYPPSSHFPIYFLLMLFKINARRSLPLPTILTSPKCLHFFKTNSDNLYLEHFYCFGGCFVALGSGDCVFI